MSFKFNPFTGTFDQVGGSGSFSLSIFDLILTGPTECLYAGPTAPLDVLIDNDGNVLTGV